MSTDELGLQEALESAQMNEEPNPAHRQAVHERMLAIAQAGPRRHHRQRGVWMAAVVLVGAGGISLAATQAGRDWVRSIFTPIETHHAVSGTMPDGGSWTRSRNAEPFTPQEQAQAVEEFDEVYRIKHAGGGRLVGLLEGPAIEGVPGGVTYLVAYTLGDGQVTTVGAAELTEQQAANMRIDEIMELRDSGAGEVSAHQETPIGLGNYTVRLTLADGTTVDLTTWYPPGTRRERQAIFAETRQLKDALRFTVDGAFQAAEESATGVWGLLRYELADGRTVGIIEPVPAAIVSEDGTGVVMPDSDAVPVASD